MTEVAVTGVTRVTGATGRGKSAFQSSELVALNVEDLEWTGRVDSHSAQQDRSGGRRRYRCRSQGRGGMSCHRPASLAGGSQYQFEGEISVIHVLLRCGRAAKAGYHRDSLQAGGRDILNLKVRFL
jgi:hypothetical protein